MSLQSVSWEHEDEDLQFLKEWFYPEHFSLAQDLRHKATSKVWAYETRGPIPHSVETTAFLTSALLSEETGTDAYVVRLAYSMALIRFVNGMVDAVQQPPFTLPTYHLAKVLGIPSHFVELRHSATHEALPSLELLREFAIQARSWLWTNYWSLIDAGSSNRPAKSELDKEKVKNLFREWRRLRREAPSKTVSKSEDTPYSQKYWSIINSISDYQRNNEEQFIDHLFSLNILIPKNSKSSVSAHIQLYAPLLNMMTEDGFMDRFAIHCIERVGRFRRDQLLAEVNNENMPTQEESEFTNGIINWLNVLFTHVAGLYSNPWFQDTDCVLETVIKYPEPWASSLLDTYIESFPVEELNSRIATLAGHLSRQFSLVEEPTANQSTTEIEADIANYKLKLKQLQMDTSKTQDNQRSRAAVWALNEAWEPRPIGVL